jgi:hypothetical protein
VTSPGVELLRSANTCGHQNLIVRKIRILVPLPEAIADIERVPFPFPWPRLQGRVHVCCLPVGGCSPRTAGWSWRSAVPLAIILRICTGRLCSLLWRLRHHLSRRIRIPAPLPATSLIHSVRGGKGMRLSKMPAYKPGASLLMARFIRRPGERCRRANVSQEFFAARRGWIHGRQRILLVPPCVSSFRRAPCNERFLQAPP